MSESIIFYIGNLSFFHQENAFIVRKWPDETELPYQYTLMKYLNRSDKGLHYLAAR